jgi:phage gpG-like protein
MAVTITVDDKRVTDVLGKLLGALSNPHDALAEIGAVVTENVRLGFADGKDPYGRPWAPVKRGGSPLRDTGMLMNSWAYRVDGDSVVVGSNRRDPKSGAYIATIHQFGRGRIPARPMLPEGTWPESWARDVAEVVNDYLREAL